MSYVPLDWNLLWSAVLKVGLAYLFALPAGFMSEREGHAVGIRTFPIVAMAACGFMLIIQDNSVSPVSRTEAFGNYSRVLQGLVTGIGFVGGGAILKDGMSVHGTAVAASIWNTGAIGAAVAMGHYEIGLVLSVLNMVTLKGLVPLKKRLDRDSSI